MGSIIKTIHLEESAGEEQDFILEWEGVGGLSAVGVTATSCLKWCLFFHDKHRMAKNREVVDGS